MNTYDPTAEPVSRLSRGLPDSPADEMALAAARYPEPEMLDPEEEQQHYEAYMERAGYEDRPCRCCSAAILVPVGADPLCQQCQKSASKIWPAIGTRDFVAKVASHVADDTLAGIAADPSWSLHVREDGVSVELVREVYSAELARRVARREIVGAA